MNFKAKMIVAVTVLTAGLLCATAWFHFHFYRMEMVESISNHQFTLVSALAEEIDHKILGAQEHLQAIVSIITPEILADTYAAQGFLDIQRDNQLLFDDGLSLVSVDGQVLAEVRSDSEPLRDDCFHADHYRRKTIEKRWPQISEPFSPAIGLRPVVLFTAPVFSGDGEVAAVLSGSLNLLNNNFLGHLAEVRLGQAGYLYLYNHERTLIVHPDRSRIMQQDVPPGVNRMFDLALEGFEGTGETLTSKGLHALSSFKRLKSTGWILAANFPVTEAFASITAAKRHFFLGLSASLMFTAFFVWALMRHLLNPLSKLSHQLRSFSEQGLPAPIEIESRDEIGELASAFNQMLSQIANKDKALVGQLHFLQVLIDAMPQPIFYKDAQGRYLGCNKSFEKYLGITREALVGKTPYDLAPRELANIYFRADAELYSQGLDANQVYESSVQYADGSRHDVIFYKANFPDPQGDLGGLVGTILDISERKRAEKELQKLSLAVEQSPASVMITDLCGNIEYVNPKFTRVTGYSLAEVQGINPRFLKSGSMSSDQYRELWETLAAGEEWHGDFHNRKKDGSLFWERASISPVRDSSGDITHYVAVKEDITDRKQYEQQLEYLATHDELTGLANRALLLDRLNQAMHYADRSQRPIAVLLLDLDRFKIVNDSLGHAAGDRLLCCVAKRIQKEVRETDTVARLGGDEFVVLLTDLADEDDVGRIANKILLALCDPIQLDGHQISLTGSLGVSLYPADGDEAEGLIRNSDLAMYRAKHEQSRFSFYSPEMDRKAQDALEFENALRQAIQRNEFFLEYQPKVNLRNGRTVGCEALVRWNHPQRGLISPAEFIPLAEETGLIEALGAWVLHEACRQNLAWQEEGLRPLRIAVNLSARQFHKKDLVQQVRKILDETGLAPQWLELELTESMLMHNPDEAVIQMQTLRDLGISLSLDDFGTGYSSLAYLSRFTIDSLKIDRLFVKDIDVNPNSAMIATSIISLAHRMRLKVVAEGVETLSQRNFLQKNGCDQMQGYLFSRPLAAEQFAHLMSTNQEEQEVLLSRHGT